MYTCIFILRMLSIYCWPVINDIWIASFLAIGLVRVGV